MENKKRITGTWRGQTVEFELDTFIPCYNPALENEPEQEYSQLNEEEANRKGRAAEIAILIQMLPMIYRNRNVCIGDISEINNDRKGAFSRVESDKESDLRAKYHETDIFVGVQSDTGEWNFYGYEVKQDSGLNIYGRMFWETHAIKEKDAFENWENDEQTESWFFKSRADKFVFVSDYKQSTLNELAKCDFGTWMATGDNANLSGFMLYQFPVRYAIVIEANQARWYYNHWRINNAWPKGSKLTHGRKRRNNKPVRTYGLAVPISEVKRFKSYSFYIVPKLDPFDEAKIFHYIEMTNGKIPPIQYILPDSLTQGWKIDNDTICDADYEFLLDKTNRAYSAIREDIINACKKQQIMPARFYNTVIEVVGPSSITVE